MKFNFLEKIFENFHLNFLSKGNKKNNLPVKLKQGDNCIVNIFNVQSLSVKQIEELTNFNEVPESEQLLGDVKKRFLTEEIMKQKNLSDILKKSSLSDINSSDTLEKDWFLRWMDISKKVSREEMQNILSKILRGEIQQPGRFSPRTLEIVRNLSRRELEIFKKVVALSWNNDCVITLGKSLLTEFGIEKYGISYDDFLLINEAGLVSDSNSAQGFSTKVGDKIKFNIAGGTIIKTSTKDQELRMSAILFTLPGREIAPLIGGENNKKEEYIINLNKYLDSIL